MEKANNKIDLLNAKRFKACEEDKKLWLKKLSFKKGLRLQENLLSSEFVWLWRKNFLKDNPVCLAKVLKKKK